MSAILLICLICCAILAVNSGWELVYPSYSNQQISENIVDTWETHSLAAVLFMAIVTSIVVAALTLLFGKQPGLSGITLIVGLVAAALTFASQVALWHQVTSVTGRMPRIF